MTNLSVEFFRAERAARDAARIASMPTVAALAALDPAEVLGQSWYDVFPGARSHRPRHDELLGGPQEVLDFPRITFEAAPGAARHFSARLRPVPADDGRAVAMLAVVTDVSDQVEAEEALRLSEERFRAITQHSRDLIIVCSREGRILYASSALQTVSGIAPTDRVGGSVFERLHPDDAVVARARIAQLVKDASLGVATKLELRLTGADGDWRWIECTAANLLDHPAVGGIVLNCRDITDRKRSEAELAAAELRLDTALRTSKTVYWTIDVRADRAAMSRHFFELTGIDRQEWEAERHPWLQRMHPDDYSIVHRAYEDYLAGHGEFYECEYRLRTPRKWT